MIPGCSTTQNAGLHWASLARCAHCLLMVGLISGFMLVSAWAAVYQCVDKTGKTILTNRPTGLRHCHVIIEDTVAGSKTGAGRKSQGSTEPIDSGVGDGLTPIPLPNDSGYPRMDNPNAPPPTSSIPSPPGQPCPPGVNPLNPLNDIPCSSSGEPQPGGMVIPR